MVPKPKKKPRNKSNSNSKHFKKEILFRELKLSILNAERYRCIWREMLTNVKMPDMWKKVEIVWQTLEHAFDFKDYSISLLLDSLQEAEDQRRKANGAHVEVIDRSLEAHEARLQVVDALFYGDVEKAIADKAFQIENINYCRNEKEIVLRKINLLVNHRSENTLNAAKSAAISKIDAFMEDGRNERRIVTTQLRKKLENLWNDLRNVFSDYRQSTEDRRKGYEAIGRKDRIDQQTITRQYLRIATIVEEIAKFREKINSYRSESGIELQEIIRETNFFHNVYRETNECFISGQKKDKYRTMTMSREYNNSVKYLEQLSIKAERILVYMQICRKYETQDEKILPTIDNHPVQLLPITNNDVLSLEAMKDFQTSLNFWRRLGFAKLITTELGIERDRLLIQANDLIKLVKRYLTDEANLTYP